jgi:O-antigen ligase/tetratricopeptide (TPR) repeat protein
MSRTFELEDGLLLAAIALLPWAFGGVELWAFRSASLLVVSAFCVALWKRGVRGLGWRQAGERWLLATFLLAAWAWVQVLPLPSSVIGLVSPHTERIYAETLPGYPETAPRRALGGLERLALERAGTPERSPDISDEPRPEVDCGGLLRTLSLVPSATLERSFWYLTLLAAFLVVRSRTARPETARIYRWVLFCDFAALAAFGLIQRASWNGALYWIRPLFVEGLPFGPYVNPSHFAGAMELAVPWLAGYAWSRLQRAKSRGRYPTRHLFLPIAAVLCFVAGLATASKAALVLLPAGLLALALLGARTARSRAWLGGTAALLVLILALTVGGTAAGQRMRSYLDRLEGLDVGGGRTAGWVAASSMMRDYPLTGVGFGAFAEVYPRYLPPGEYKRWSQLHNDYFESLVEGGLVAAILISLIVWGYGSRLVRDLLRGEVARSRLGLVLGLTTLALHGFVDFNHQIPANALLFVTLAAMALPLDVPTPLRAKPMGRERRWLLPAVVLVLLVFSDRAASGVVSGVAFARAAILKHQDQAERAGPFLDIAARRDLPLLARRELADARMRRWDDLVEREGYERAGAALLESSARDYAQCACLSPAGWRAFEGLARVYHGIELLRRTAYVGTGERQALGSPGWIAIGMQRMAIDRAPNVFIPYDRLAEMLRDYGLEREELDAVDESAARLPLFPRRTFPDDGSLTPAMLERFADGAERGISTSPELDHAIYRIALGRVQLLRGENERAIEALESALVHKHDAMQAAEIDLLLGEAHRNLGHADEARRRWEAAAKNPALQDTSLRKLAQLARESGRTEDELTILTQLRSLDPDDLELCLDLAAAASRLERWPQAQSALRRARLLGPSDPRPAIALVESYIAQGDLEEARSELRSVEQSFEGNEAIQQLRDRLASIPPTQRSRTGVEVQ